jgi:hypothetical protein
MVRSSEEVGTAAVDQLPVSLQRPVVAPVQLIAVAWAALLDSMAAKSVAASVRLSVVVMGENFLIIMTGLRLNEGMRKPRSFEVSCSADINGIHLCFECVHAAERSIRGDLSR